MDPHFKSLREFDGELIKNWYILALLEEIPRHKPIRRLLYDQAYVLFRNSSGQVQVLLDRCPHRGAQLSKGRILQGRITCPYHGWQIDGSGNVISVPSDGPMKTSNTNRIPNCLHAPTVVVQDNCVWIWPHETLPDPVAPPWRFPFASGRSDSTYPFMDSIDKTGKPPKLKSYFMITDFENETDHLIQNFMDVPHTVFVHSKWFRNKTLLKVPVSIDVADGRVKVHYIQENDSIGFTDFIMNPKKEKMIHTDEFIFPNLTRVDYSFGKKFFIINSQCTPISRYKTRVFTWIAFNRGMWNPLMKPFMKFYTRKVIQQDVEIMKNQGDNLRFFGETSWRSTQADELHLAIDRIRNLGRIKVSEALQVQFKRDREFWI